MLQVSGLTKVFGEDILFEEVTFSLIAGERLGLVGRNGSGKSTLFKLILGIEAPDEGSISMPRGYRIGHLAQHLVFTEHTILDEACLGLQASEKNDRYKAEIILAGLGFTEGDFLRAPSEFSGGFQIRINLAKLLLSEPNLLLLDEPTNYLDIVSMRWLTEFLTTWSGEMILISHDRMFMDAVCTHTMFLHRGEIKKIQGNTEKLYQQVKEEEAIYEKTKLNEDKKRKQLELFIARFRAQASKAAMVQSKIKALARMGQKESLQDEATLDFQFRAAPFPGKVVGEIENASFHYPEGPVLIKDLKFMINKNDRIAIIGKNGKGKSTLLKLLAGENQPTEGEVKINLNTKIGYFGQTNISRLNDNNTIEQEIFDSNSSLSRTAVRSICGAMMFSGDDALKKIDVLSGGEKSRVLLGKLLAEPSNLLLLDEPTNHLDMESIDGLMDSIDKYDGAVIIVTHSELLLKRLAKRLVIFEGPTPELFEYSYDYFLEKRGWSDEQAMSQSGAQGTQKSRESIEKKIVALEAEQLNVEAALAEAYGDGEEDKAQLLLKKLAGVEGQINKLYQML